ncbi:MAG: holo-ACP synthase [Pseudomonadota bacterium]
MILGLGVDLVRVSRIERAVARFGERFFDHILGPEERRHLNERRGGRLGEWVAARFAAKEAFMKAVGLGLTKGLSWRDIEVIPDGLGKPCLRLSGRAAELCRERGALALVSLAHEAGLAMATVILDGTPR